MPAQAGKILRNFRKTRRNLPGVRITAGCKETAATESRRSGTGSKKSGTASRNAWIDWKSYTTTDEKLWMKRDTNKRAIGFLSWQKQTDRKRMPRSTGRPMPTSVWDNGRQLWRRSPI